MRGQPTPGPGGDHDCRVRLDRVRLDRVRLDRVRLDRVRLDRVRRGRPEPRSPHPRPRSAASRWPWGAGRPGRRRSSRSSRRTGCPAQSPAAQTRADARTAASCARAGAARDQPADQPHRPERSAEGPLSIRTKRDISLAARALRGGAVVTVRGRKELRHVKHSSGRRTRRITGIRWQQLTLMASSFGRSRLAS